MRLNVLLFIGIFLSCEIGIAQSGAIEWQKCFGGTDKEFAKTVELTIEGGYIMLGATRSKNGDITILKGDCDVWVVKVDDTGMILWQKTLGGTGLDMGADIKATSDSGYIITATTNSTNGDVFGNHGKNDIWVVKLDSAGAIQWKKCFGGTDDDEAASIQPTTDGGYIFIGKSFSNNGDVLGNYGSGDIWVVKLDNIGIIQWHKCIGGIDAEKAAAITLRKDGGYYIAGSTFSNTYDVLGNHGDFDYWVVSLDENGNIDWQKPLGGTNTDEATSIYTTADSGVVVAGYSYSNNEQVTGNHGLHDFWIVKMDKTGNLQWQKSAGGSQTDVPNSIIQITDRGYVVAGTTYSTNADVSGNKGSYDYWVIKLNSSGVLENQLCLGGVSTESAACVKETANGEFIVLGESFSTTGDVTNMHGYSDMWLVKLQSIPLNVKEVNSHRLSTYPEPVKDILHFTESLEYIAIYTVDGKKIKEAFNTDKIDIQPFSSGIYFVRGMDKQRKMMGKKFVKE